MLSTDTTLELRVSGRRVRVPLVEGDRLQVVRHAESRPERFLWLPKQRHIPGFYWAATNRGFVPFESQLERGRVVLADFDHTVSRIVSQPFDMIAEGQVYQIPDFMLLHVDGRITIVNVKRPEDAAKPKVLKQFARVTRALLEVGWVHEIWTGDASPFARNVEHLSAYMRPQLALNLAVNPAALTGYSFGAAVEALERIVGEDARAQIGAALWRHELLTDLSVPLSEASILWAAA